MLVFILLFLSGLPAAANEWVRVRLANEETQLLTVSGEVTRLQGLESVHRFVSIPQKQTLNLKYENGRWIVVGFKAHPIILERKLLALEGKGLSVNGRKVPGKIILSAGKTSVDVIGVLPLESYITGVLAHEMPRQWPLETLKAQAIAARSYAMAVMKERKNKIYHLESSVLDQVYSFLSEDELKARFDRPSEAVNATWGQILLTSQRKILKAYYHADCGGETATAEEAWTSKEELVSVQDSSCPQNPRADWRLSLSAKEVKNKLKKFASDSNSDVESMTVVTVPGRLRVSQVMVEWENGFKKGIQASAFREAFGFFDFKSTQFKLGKSGSDWVFAGRGFGHGVGLCQWGSRHLGSKGWDYKKIIQHYYPKAELKVLEVQVADLKDQKIL